MGLLKIVIAADHRGYALKEYIKQHAISYDGHEVAWIDVGADSEERSDYPEFAIKAVEAMSAGKAEKALLLCGSGNGMAITANRFKGIYAGLAWNEEIARLAKEDDNCNVLVIPADYIKHEESVAMITAWLKAEFKDGRYEERLKLIDSI